VMRSHVWLPLLLCLACERAAPPSNAAVSSSTVTTRTDIINYAPEDSLLPAYEIAGPDSAFGAWGVSGSDISPGEFYIASHVRHPSGSMVIWFDTAVRATEEHPVGHAHVDSVVVNGVRHLEYLGRFCVLGQDENPPIVGLVYEGDSLYRARLAWKFNTETLRIERLPPDSARCRITDPLEGEVD
jgi:hypothetical protein